MKTKIIAGKNQIFTKLHLEAHLDQADLNHEDLIIIDLTSDETGTKGIGVGLAKEWAKDEEKVVILVGFKPEELLMEMDEFREVMSYSNVGYVDLLEPKMIPEMYELLSSGLKANNETAKAIYSFNRRRFLIDRLRHEGVYVKIDSEEASGWLKRARRLGFTGSNEEVYDQVRHWQSETCGEFEGRMLAGIFVEAYQTLFERDWTLAQMVKAKVECLAQEKERMIFVITDRDRHIIRRRLARNGIRWPVVSTLEIQGAILEIVIDYLSSEEFLSIHKIKVEQFIQVAELQS